MRVIIELVINHTSDQHPWFQRARRRRQARPSATTTCGATPTRSITGRRIIFTDTEHSNWTWDPVAQGRTTGTGSFRISRISTTTTRRSSGRCWRSLDFWLDMGVDGLRLDAVPYLFEREGTNCENLPETHAFLKAHPRAHRCEGSRTGCCWPRPTSGPSDVRAYFGDGDECHMAFHFPLMPRMFMALHLEDRLPIVDIMEQTPPIPDTCQWALFLRNHDELTLEMVTDEERDYMYLAYAQDPQARINLGIRRRLAPLVRNRSPPHRAAERPAVLAARARPSSTTATRSAWATTSISAIATACARRCSGPAIATRGFSRADPAAAVQPGDHGPGLRIPGGER